MFTLPNSRTHEAEADRIGVELAARAGYDPRAAVTLWQKMGALSQGSAPPEFLSTHPSASRPSADLTEAATKVLPLSLGRASCRERVCQAGSIRVVAVRLQTKEHA